LIRAYQLVLSPLLPPACRFYPSCSHYAVDALSEYGLLRGSAMALKRLASCHPFHPGGVDLVAPAGASSKGSRFRCTRSRT
jgi:putative membrane protein insertion efficiency factor